MSTWKVLCVAATLSSTKTNFQTWDDQFDQMGGGGPGGPGSGGPGSTTGYLPDPFCQLSTGNDRVAGATTVIADTTTPRWNESITPSPLTAAQLMSQSTPWAISVEDDDGRAATELACRITPQLSANDFVSTDVSFNNVQSCLTLNIRLVCSP